VQSITDSTQASAGAASETGVAAEAAAATTEAKRTGATNTNALVQDLYALVVHLQKTCNTDVFEALGALELSLTQLKLLHHLEHQPRALTLGEAAALVHVSLPAASRLVDDLVRRGFVERYEDAEDRRMKRVRLTGDGQAVIRQFNAARLGGLQQFVAGLGEDERAALGLALGKLLARSDVAACRPDTAR
jgi:DNA-binding MarR family transcriptional regulator